MVDMWKGIPLDAVQCILEYLAITDQLSLLGSCKSPDFQLLLREKRFIILKPHESSQFFLDHDFRSSVMNSIVSPSQQLYLNVDIKELLSLNSLPAVANSFHTITYSSSSFDEESLTNFLHIITNVKNLIFQIQAYWTSSASFFSLPVFQGLHKLHLGGCDSLHDLSIFSNLLELQVETNIELNVTELKNLIHLNVVEAPLILGLTHLKHLKRLQWNLESNSPTDLEMDLKQAKIIEELEQLPNLQSLQLLKVGSQSLMRFPFIPSLQEVELFNYPNLQEIDHLAHVKKYIKLNGYCAIHNISSIHSCEKVELEDCPLVHDISTMSHVQNLILGGECAIDNIPYLPNLRRIELLGIDQIVNVSHLSHLFEVSLYYCNGVKDISMLGKVQILSIVGCESIIRFCKPMGKRQHWDLSSTNIEDLTGFETLHSLYLIGCKQVRHVAHLKDLAYLNIMNCSNIEDLDLVKGLKSVVITKLSLSKENTDDSFKYKSVM